jgi:UDP-N-acetylmuramoyl-tripeptide--D-alanyl-D-alanine ligase
VIPLTAADVAAIVGGTLHDVDDEFTLVGPSVHLDSRQVGQSGLFVAIEGEHVDGHDFAAAARAAGAALVLASRRTGVPSVIVDNVVLALGLLAKANIARLRSTVVLGITGSTGKTSTKDLMAQLLERLGATIAPPGSFNNELGLPLTALQADQSTQYVILEMGARGANHIAYLCHIAQPTLGVVLNVGTAHVSEFGNREAIARAKGELVEALPPAGLAVLNADDAAVLAMASRSAAPVVTFGRSLEADVRAEELTLESGRARFRLVTPEGSADVRLSLVGEHHVANALAAAAVARHVGMSLPQIAAALSEAEPRSRWRMEVHERADGVTVVNDAYNANPESVRAALKSLVALGEGRRTWAVLGEMRELGPESAAEHDAVGRIAVRLDISRLVVVGEGARAMHLGASHEGSWGNESTFVPDVAAAIDLLSAELRPGDVVLVKASRAGGLERVADALLTQSSVPSTEARA